MKFLLSLFIFLIAACEGLAQHPIGLKVGINLSKIHSNRPFEKYSFSPFYQIGITSQVKLVEDKFYFQPELLYSQKGSSVEKYGSLEEKIKLRSFDIAIILKYQFASNWYVDLGTIFSISDRPDNHHVDNSKIWRIYFGFSKTLNSELSFDVSYNYSITELANYQNWTEPYIQIMERDSTIQFSIRYLFMETIK
jgi:hypothetical protein